MDEETAREFAALKARCDDLERRLSGVLTLVTEAMAQNIGQRIIAGAVLAEIGLLHPDPGAKVSMMGAGLFGVLEQAGLMLRQEAATAAHTTKEIEEIIAIAERVLPTPRAPPQRPGP